MLWRKRYSGSNKVRIAPIHWRKLTLLADYERMTANDKNNRAVFYRPFGRSRALVEMGAQVVDRGKTHHAFRHLRFDGTVGIKRIGHAVDDATLQHRHARRRLFGARRRALGRGRIWLGRRRRR